MAQPKLPMRWRFFSGVLTGLWISLLCACATQESTHITPTTVRESPGMVARDAESKPLLAEEYRLSVGDQIDVKFFYSPELNESLVIRPDGAISLQLVGQVMAAGLTPTELETRLTELFKTSLRRPQATVIVRRYTPQRIYVGGETVQQIALPMDGPISVLQSILQAGGFKFGAERSNILVFRAHPAQAITEVFVVNLDQQLEVQRPEQGCQANDAACRKRTRRDYVRIGDMPLRANDVVFVPQSKISRLAQYVDENIGRILPLYKNTGFSFYYNLRNDRTTITLPAQ